MTPYGYPPEYYHCLLDEQPYYLVPPRLYGKDPNGPLIVNPLCWFSWHGPLPPDKAARATSAEFLYPGEWMVWVEDAATRALWPYWLEAEFAAYLSELAPGYPVKRAIPPHAVWVLTRAQILVQPNFPEQRRREWMEQIWTGAKSFERGYTNVPGLVPPFHLGAMRRYYRHHTRLGSFTLGDGQVARRHVAHNDGVARFFQHQLVPAVSDIARTMVKPSYSYLAAYESGAQLDRHTDREQCEYSITMCIDATPEPRAQSPWPIYLDIPEGALGIWQYLGDGLMYRGRYLPHYRTQLHDGCTATALLLHYVDNNYAGQLW